MKWILALPLFLAACAAQVEPVQPITIQTQPIPRPALTLPPVDEFRGRNVEWIVVTPETVESVFAGLESRGQAVALFAVTGDDFENLSVNNQQALRVITQQQSVIDGYRAYYIVVDRAVALHNQTVD